MISRIVYLSCLVVAAATTNPAYAGTANNNWSGPYLGVNLGWGFPSADTSGRKLDPNGFGSNRTASNSSDWDGFVGGGHLGFNWVVSQDVVLGLEGGISGASLKLNSVGISNDGISYKTTDIDSIATIRGRAGYIHNNWMFFGSGGMAQTRVRLSNTQGPCGPGGNNPTCAGSSVPLGAMDSNSINKTGWTLGAGVELAINSKWTTRVEYLHFDFGSFDSANPTFNRVNTVSLKMDLVQVGLDYKF